MIGKIKVFENWGTNYPTLKAAKAAIQDVVAEDEAKSLLGDPTPVVVGYATHTREEEIWAAETYLKMKQDWEETTAMYDEDPSPSTAYYLSHLSKDMQYFEHNFPMDTCEDFPASTLVAEGLGDGWKLEAEEGSTIFLSDWDDQEWRIPRKELRHFIELCNTSDNEDDFEPYKYEVKNV